MTAWVKSLNTPFVALNKKVGRRKLGKLLLGQVFLKIHRVWCIFRMFWSATAMKPIDIAKAYTSIVSGGMKFEPFIVDSAIDSKGNVVYKGEKKGEEFSRKIW